MQWHITLFETQSGDKPVETFIRSLDQPTIAKISHKIDLLQAYGTFVTLPHAKKIAPELYELRIRGKTEIRIIYTFKQTHIYLLHAFKKKTDKIPSKEIKIATQRFQLLP